MIKNCSIHQNIIIRFSVIIKEFIIQNQNVLHFLMTLELQQEKIKQYSNYYPDTCTCPRLLKYSNVYYLRLLIDDNFYWNTHINNIIVKLRQLTYFF